jgi:hypothetical protein
VGRVPFSKIQFSRQALFFLLIGLAGSLPFLISTRQHNRYIFHSYPFFALCVAFLTDSIAARIELLLNDRPKIRGATLIIAMVFFLAAITSMLYKKDHIRGRVEFNQDIYLQNIDLPERITISACPEWRIHDDWLFADMMRFYKVSLSPQMGREYLLVAKNSGCEVPDGYQRINREPTLRYILYKKGLP